MMTLTKVRVPVPSAAAGVVEMYVNNCGLRGPRNGGLNNNDWATLRATPQKVLEWFATAGFAVAGGSEEVAPFAPCASRLANLDGLKTRAALPVPIPRFWLLDASSGYAFDAGQHLPYWLAKNDASFVPLLVPAHQMAHFSQQLV